MKLLFNRKARIIAVLIFAVLSIGGILLQFSGHKPGDEQTPDGGDAAELSSGVWQVAGNNSFAVKAEKLNAGVLSGRDALSVSYDLDGVCLLGGPSSAIVLVAANGRTYGVSLADYGTNCAYGGQVAVIPLTDFGLDQDAANIELLRIQFWYPAQYSFQIDRLSAHTSADGLNREEISKNLLALLWPDARPLRLSRLIANILPSPTPVPGNNPPVAIATATVLKTTAPAPVEFRGYKSYDIDKDPLSYKWVFGDGNVFNEANANHTYSRNGTFIAQFSVSDGKSIVYAAPITITIGSVPTPSPSALPTTSPTPSATPSPTPTPAPSPLPTVSVTPTPTAGLVDKPPVAVATARILSNIPPAAVEFRGYQSYDPEGRPLKYRWVFGDGNTFNEANANHTYFRTGVYIVQFSVSDGVSTTFAAPITVQIFGTSVSPSPSPLPAPSPTPSATPSPTPTPIAAGWTFCATENQTCAFTGTKEVRYGVDGFYYYKVLSGGTPCTNAVFGDPLKGTLKQCHYRDTTVTPAPTPVPTPTPTPTTSPASTWSIKSVSSMKETKDRICNKDTAANINAWVARAGELGVNYIAVETPYDDPSCSSAVDYTRVWTDAVRAKGLNVWHRHAPLAFEGIYNTAKDNNKDYILQISNYIKANPSFFREGDIFTPIPEPQNGGIAGITYCPQGICMFTGAAHFNKWLRDAMTASEAAFASVGLGGKIKIGYYGFDGFVAWGDNNPDWDGILEDATVVAMGNITIDHYPELVGDTMKNDLDELQRKYPNTPIVIGEWGTVTSGDPVYQVNQSMQASIRPNVIGFNYWHMGRGGNEALVDSNLLPRIHFDTVKSYFLKN